MKKGIPLLFLALFLTLAGCSNGTEVIEEAIQPEENETAQNDTEANEEETEQHSWVDSMNLSSEEKKMYDKVEAVTEEEKIISFALMEDVETDVVDAEYIYIQLNFDVEDIQDTNAIRDSILEESKAIFIALSEVTELSAIRIESFTPLINQQGDEVSVRAILIELRRATLDEINWDDFTIDEFEELADHYRQDPLLDQ